MAEDLSKTADPYHCVICGTHSQVHLCGKHYREYLNRWGGLPVWLREMQADNERRGDLLRKVPETLSGDRTDVLQATNLIV